MPKINGTVCFRGCYEIQQNTSNGRHGIPRNTAREYLRGIINDGRLRQSYNLRSSRVVAIWDSPARSAGKGTKKQTNSASADSTGFVTADVGKYIPSDENANDFHFP